MAHRLDVVALRVDDEGAVVVRVVLGAQAGGAVVLAAGGDRGGVEGVYLGAGLGLPGQVAARGGRRAAVGGGAVDEPHVGLLAVGLGGVGVGEAEDVHAVVALKANAVAQGRKGGAVERFGALDVGDAEGHVVKHGMLLWDGRARFAQPIL
jgi:hypothetical protein